MRLLPLCLLAALLRAPAAHAQQPADSTWQLPAAYRVSSQPDPAGGCVEIITWDTPAALLRAYHATGQLREYVPFANLALGLRHGLVSTWYASGQVASLQPYLRGRREGELLLFYEDGRLKRQGEFQAGTELRGRGYAPDGQPLPYYPYEQPPLYPGGLAQLTKELNQRLRWPREARQLPGSPPILVSISFVVNPDGCLSEPRVEVPSRAPALDQAVLAALGQLRRAWQPGRLDGQLAAIRYRLPIEFKAPPLPGVYRPL